MPYNALADFLEELAEAGQLVRVGAQVDATLEIAEITRRVAAEGGPALLFERVAGQSMAVVTNLLGTERRACRALGIESLDAIAARIESLVEAHTPQNWFERLKMTGESGAEKFRAKPTKSGACQQVVHLGRDVNLATFPLLKSWPGESGPAVTGSLVTEDRGTHVRGATATPLVALDENRLAVVDDGHSGFSRHWADHRAEGQRMPAAVVLGGDPAGTIAASLELPPDIDAYLACGLLRGKAVDVVKCKTHALEVPAEADLVLEGYCDPDVVGADVTVAGAGGSHYRAPLSAPVFHVAAVTHRSHPIFPAWVDGPGAGDARVLVKARERLLLPALRGVAPDVVDLELPLLGGVHRYAFVSIRKRFPFHARQIAAALWGTEALKFTKFLILVDRDVDVHDVPSVLAHVGANVAPKRDVFTFEGPAHRSDHAAGPAPLVRHVAIDATAKLAGEQAGRWPEVLDAGDQVRQLVTARWAEYKLDLG